MDEVAPSQPMVERENWRESVRQGMLAAVPWFAPPVILVAIVFRSGSASPVDDVVLVATGILLPVVRLMRRWSSTRRALLMILIACSSSIFLLARIGLTAGLSVALATFSVLGLVCAGRRAGLAIIGVTACAYLVIGLLVSQRIVPLTAIDTDPHHLRNWIRMGGVSSLLSVLLMTIVDFVIRHVEESSGAATEALGGLRRAMAERAVQEKDLRVAYERLGQLHQKLEAMKEEERRSLSRELHDELGQSLTALKLRLQLGAPPPGAPAGGPALEPLALVDDLISRVRRISVGLRPPLLDEVGLVSALRVYLESQAAVSGVAIDFDADETDADPIRRLPPDFEIICFRVVQESVTNALRHARARHIQVRLARAGDRLALSVRDDGRGLDPVALDDAAARGHLGVVGMQERVRARGGQFRLTSSPGGGTTVDVEMDVPPTPELTS